MRQGLRMLAVGAVLLTFPAIAFAQDRGTVTGTVVDQATQRPLAGAQITVGGTTLGTITNQQGRFLIPNVPAGPREVRAMLIGYRGASQTVDVTAGGSVTVEFQLAQSAVALDEVVVTGTAGRQERRAQSAVIASVDAASVVETAPVASVTDLLQGRVTGVSITQSSGTSGTAQRIRLRGQASINLSNEPIVFIDGVRADSRQTQLYAVGGQVGSRLNDINPEDIESIEIVKGPAAATLYGADASAGVIQIRTKRGRVGGGFQQSFSAEYHTIDANYTPPANYGVCTAAMVTQQARTLCYGQEPGTIVWDRPSDRYPVFRQGSHRGLSWSGRGGGESFGYYMSIGSEDEDGTHGNNNYERLSNTFNFNFTPNERLRFEAGWTLGRVRTRLPRNDNDIYGFLGGIMLGSPTTVGLAQDGWYAANRQTDALNAYQNVTTAIRAIPRFAVMYNPTPWFSNRLQAGVDMTRTSARQFYPRNDRGWYGTATLNSGSMNQARQNRDDITFDYLGNISTRLTDSWTSELSFGSQINYRRTDLTYATGTGFITNAANAIDAAAQRTGGGNFGESSQAGFFGQWQPVFRDRLYLQFAARLDRASAFGTEADWFLSPKLGASWVLSEEGFWMNAMPEWINTFRLRAAYGTTGRSPTAGSIATYNASPFAITTNQVESGVTPNDPGNPALRPERGEEFEGGFDLELLNGRLGFELTYFNKVSKDLILARPVAPSLGFSVNPLVNIGEMVNRGFEIGMNATVVNTPVFGWDLRAGLNTLHNEVRDLGDVDPIGTTVRVLPGYQVNSRFTHRIREIITDPTVALTRCTQPANPAAPRVTECAIVSDTTEWIGNFIPGLEGNLSTTLTFLRNFRVDALLTMQNDFVIYNNTDQFRERQFGQGERWVRRAELPAEERVRRFGQFQTESTGAVLNPSAVEEAYIERGDFVRLRELSFTYTLPESYARLLRASNASVSLAGRNLKLWTDYSGPDPEMLGAATTTSRTDFLTLPQARRWVARVNLNF